MTRNSNSHFAQLPVVSIGRSVLNRSWEHKLTGNVGDLIPIYLDADILPGDTVSIDTSKIIRFQTLLSPVMDNMYADFYFFFVPNRLLWDHWINFMGENDQSAWTPTTAYSVPVIKVPPSGSGSNNYVGSILDYLGFPVEMPIASGTYQEINALPVRAYAKICDDWFRTESLTDPLNFYTGDSAVVAATDASYINDVPQGGAPYKVSKFRDYFTSCLPTPERGDAVKIASSNKDLPVYAKKETVPQFSTLRYNFYQFANSQDANAPGGYAIGWNSGSDTVGGVKHISPNVINGVDPWPAYDNEYGSPLNLWADATQGFLFSVNDLRFAFQMQKLLEKDARAGGRYKEVIKSHFNVDSPDARLQRSEYLGGNRVPIQVSQVLNSAQTSSDPLGDVGAYSVTSDYHSDFTKSFTEHGVLLGLMAIRTDKTYSQGLMPFWQRRNRFDYYWPVFSNIGEQPVPKNAIYLGATGTFGFQECWADYRFMPNRCSAEMRPYVSNNLGSWSYADDYNSAPSLSDGWIREDLTNVDRTLAVTSSTSHQFWADLYFKVRHVRPMPVYSVPGLIDHH